MSVVNRILAHPGSLGRTGFLSLGGANGRKYTRRERRAANRLRRQPGRCIGQRVRRYPACVALGMVAAIGFMDSLQADDLLHEFLDMVQEVK